MLEDLKEKYQLNDECIGELEKVVQSETDKVRTKYSKELKDLEQYKPKEKTEQEIEFEQAKAELAAMKFKESVREAGLSADLANYLRQDADLNAFSQLLKGQEQLRQDYVARNHVSNAGVTKEQFEKMDYSARAKLYAENPTLYAELKK